MFWACASTYFRELVDEVMRIGLFGTLHDLRQGGILIAKADVFRHRRGKENRILGHHTHLASEPPHIEVADVMAIHTYLLQL